jgi:hypothetical protein
MIEIVMSDDVSSHTGRVCNLIVRNRTEYIVQSSDISQHARHDGNQGSQGAGELCQKENKTRGRGASDCVILSYALHVVGSLLRRHQTGK